MKLLTSITSPVQPSGIRAPKASSGAARFIRCRDLGIPADDAGVWGGRIGPGERVRTFEEIRTSTRAALAADHPPAGDAGAYECIAASIEPLRYWERIEKSGGVMGEASELFALVGGIVDLWGFPYTPRPGGSAAMRQRNNLAALPIVRAVRSFHVVAPLFPGAAGSLISPADAAMITKQTIHECDRLRGLAGIGTPARPVYVWLDADAIAADSTGEQPMVSVELLHAVLTAVKSVQAAVCAVVQWYGVSEAGQASGVQEARAARVERYNRWTSTVLEPVWAEIFPTTPPAGTGG